MTPPASRANRGRRIARRHRPTDGAGPGGKQARRRDSPPPRRPADARDARREGARSSGPSDDASHLFAAANAARGTGDLRAAARRYNLLERRYPASPEAAVSLVSAGDVLMRLGESSAALAHFNRYLADERGPLALEALFGRARSLHDLGRRPDELETWRELLRKFPGSLYETTARRRVAELAR